MLSLTKRGITMATVKAFSDLEQSRKLAEILPLKSADMHYGEYSHNFVEYPIPNNESDYECGYNGQPAWSLAALLSVLPNGIVMNKDSQNGRYHFSSTHAGTYVTTDNPIDACVAMIEKLHELKIL